MDTIVRIVLNITLDTDGESINLAALSKISKEVNSTLLDSGVLDVLSEDIGFIITSASVGAVTALSNEDTA
jgi:hypothetical protein